MKTFIIDPVLRVVAEHDYDGDWRSIAPALDCHLFDVVGLPKGDLFVDDEGLYRDGQQFFLIEGCPQPLAGRGMLFGKADKDGVESPSPLTIDEVREMVRWVPQAMVPFLARWSFST